VSSRSGASILWRRLDVPGHDTATIAEGSAGAELRGMAVFRDEGGPTALQYRVRCNARWHTTEAQVHGWRGKEPIELRVVRDEQGHWSLNGTSYPAVAGCLELDLNFTPATNLVPLRRLNLAIGRMAEVRSAWLEWPTGMLRPLVQRYSRESAATYHYEADLPGGDTFTGVLRVDPLSWVLDYAGLWQAEAAV
jgi:hypothetical protein